jgi:hypothetical protein
MKEKKDEDVDDENARIERVFEELIAKNDEQCDKIDEHIMRARGDSAANNEKLAQSTQNDAATKNDASGKKNISNAAFHGGSSSISRPQEAFKDVVDNRTETDMNFVLAPTSRQRKSVNVGVERVETSISFGFARFVQI